VLGCGVKVNARILHHAMTGHAKREEKHIILYISQWKITAIFLKNYIEIFNKSVHK
jgi:hypothetical protein